MNLIHGEASKTFQSPEYVSWRSMRRRCDTPTHKAYARYGGRGIAVCKRWASFQNFLADMGRRPSSDYSIERENQNGNYTPKNCRWATRIEQMNNMRRNVFLTFRGERKTFADWARAMGINRKTLQGRIYAGWNVDLALTTPLVHPNRRIHK